MVICRHGDASTGIATLARLRSSRGSLRLFLLLLCGGLGTGGCVSVQTPAGPDGKPGFIGVGSARTIDGQAGQILRITAPGLSLRFGSYAPGVSLGWHQTLLFFPRRESPVLAPRPLAVQKKSFGLDLAPTSVSLGYDRRFGIFAPVAGGSVVEVISYRQTKPQETVIQRKEFP